MRTLIVASAALAIAIGSTSPWQAQTPGGDPSPVQLANQRERQRILDLLGIQAIPPGAVSSSPATYDESTANPFPDLPDPRERRQHLLRLDGGQLSQVRRPVGCAAGGLAPAHRALRAATGFLSAGHGPGPLNDDGTVPVNDAWVDPEGSFLAAVGAGRVYRLLGGTGLGTAAFPAIDTPLISGDLGFHQHPGGHTPEPTWPTFLRFAERYLPRPAAAR